MKTYLFRDEEDKAWLRFNVEIEGEDYKNFDELYDTLETFSRILKSR